MTPAPVDAVITWVDGADPAHAQRLAEHLAAIGGPRPAAAHPTRFNDAGELDYCVASILRYAPWIRTIHIVTDRQVPPLLERLRGSAHAERLRLVDHREIFAGYERHLPTFNSRAIITMLWRVPGLSENFIYFNDDFVLLQSVQPEDFFRGDKVVLRGRWLPQSARRPGRRLLTALRRLLGRDPAAPTARVRNLAAQELSARLAGFEDRYLRLYHNPFPMRRSTLDAYFREHPDHLEDNLGHRLRSAEQFKTEALAAHLEAARGDVEYDQRLRTAQLKPSEQWLPRLRNKLRVADRDPRVAFACIQSLELAAPATQDLLRDWLDRRVGRASQLLMASSLLWSFLADQLDQFAWLVDSV